MRAIVLALTCLGLTAPVAAQSEESAVLAVVNALFDGMRTKDSALVRSVFHPDAQMIRPGADGLRANGIDGFVRFVGGPSDEIWNEPIWDTEVRIDGDLASVWTKYAFFRGPEGDQFSHCGVDAFLLFKSADGWKIFTLSDTMRRDGCEMPPGH